MYFNDGFVGHIANDESHFVLTDSEKLYLHNLKTQPENWFYRNNSILYKYNEYGHRSKSVTEINLENYILFAGCSHTEGVGLQIQHTFPYIVSSRLNCHYYNLSVCGSGVDILMYNLVLWIDRFKKLPKTLVILWPEETRFSLSVNKGLDPQVLNNHNTTDDVARFMVLGEQLDFFPSRRKLYRQLISQLYANCNIIDIRFAGQQPIDAPLALYCNDFARDLSHPGIYSNLRLANEIVALLR